MTTVVRRSLRIGGWLLPADVRLGRVALTLAVSLVLFLLAFAMTVRVRNPSLALLVALAWLGSGLYFYVVDRHESVSRYSDRLARYSLVWSIEMALIFVIGGVAGMLWLRRTSSPTAMSRPGR